MVNVTIPHGFGIPLVDLATDRLPEPTMAAILADIESNIEAASLPWGDAPIPTLIFENGLV